MPDTFNETSASKGRVNVIGIYPVEITKSVLLENARFEFGDGRFYLDDVLDLSDHDFTERFKDIYLIEITIDQKDTLFDPGQFTQEESDKPRDAWQVAYNEKYLDSKGLAATLEPAPGETLRFAFFFHSPNLHQALLTPYGRVALPRATPMPERLRNLFRYVPPC